MAAQEYEIKTVCTEVFKDEAQAEARSTLEIGLFLIYGYRCRHEDEVAPKRLVRH